MTSRWCGIRVQSLLDQETMNLCTYDRRLCYNCCKPCYIRRLMEGHSERRSSDADRRRLYSECGLKDWTTPNDKATHSLPIRHAFYTQDWTSTAFKGMLNLTFSFLIMTLWSISRYYPFLFTCLNIFQTVYKFSGWPVRKQPSVQGKTLLHLQYSFVPFYYCHEKNALRNKSKNIYVLLSSLVTLNGSWRIRS